MMKYFTILALLLLARPALAQERGVNRRAFTFLDNEVTVEVTADMEGGLQVVRGEPGRIEVSGRSAGGFTSFALGGRDGTTLRLTAVGTDRADFIVVVPEDTYLRVRLPDHQGGDVSGSRASARFTWPASAETASADSPRAPVSPNGIAVAHAAAVAPRTLNVPNLKSTRAIVVRLEPGSFSVGGSEWMSVSRGNSMNVEIQTGSEPQNLEIVVPIDTRDFTLRLGGRSALVVRGREVRSYCDPMVQQLFASGNRSFTFTPENGRLICR